MIGWDSFVWFGSAAIILAASGAVAVYSRPRIGILMTLLAWVTLASFIAGLWLTLERPPLKTMGETRLWYSFFALSAGLFTYLRWRYRWIPAFSAVLATVFIIVNMVKPEIHSQALMPALQSPWFIPHVTVYMFSYSFLGCSFLMAVYALMKKDSEIPEAMDTLIYIGVAFLTFGMLSGAIWAKDAWGHYWSWDPKETWALLTWLSYLLYIHLRILHRGSRITICLLVIFSFLCLQMCWWGVNLLPSAQDSIHVYGN